MTARPRDSESPRQRIWRRFRTNRIALVALLYLGGLVLVAIFANVIAPHDPNATNGPINSGPTAQYWLGTDSTGRDILSRLIVGARASLEVALLVVVFALLVALPLGLVAGYSRGWPDAGIMRVMDGLFAFPALTLALAIAAILGPSIRNAAIAIAIPFIPGMVRLLRAQTLAVREETYVEASKSVGVTSTRMVRKHVFPNVASPMMVQLALTFGFALLAEAGLSFLNMGVQPPTASWGTMLGDAYSFILSKPWPLFPPGVAIALTVLAFNLIADGLRDALGREKFTAEA
ncbi:MAG TPA: ABC transporter permease [Acidimicrobiia bacterium]|nr:ABC transporter permease [Acidimicrobiia bacterium]